MKTDRLTVFGGGVPLVVDGRMIGAVGVSGEPSNRTWTSPRKEPRR
ncbi:heme-binding protein [Pseudonocardia sp. WMMC193]|nr:heme-binding protein [Pseudonocardia sp. WMMC193]